MKSQGENKVTDSRSHNFVPRKAIERVQITIDNFASDMIPSDIFPFTYTCILYKFRIVQKPVAGQFLHKKKLKEKCKTYYTD